MENEIVAVPVSVATPLDLIYRASQDSSTSIETLERLFNLQLRHEENESRKAYNVAMSNFRAECPAIDKTRTAHNSKFAGLAESIEVIKPVLSKHGLSHQWKTRQEGNVVTVECIVSHVLGHSESTSLSALPDKSGSKNDIQSVGSTVSYLSRYTLYAILGLASKDQDNDGNGGGKKKEVETITEGQAADLEALLAEVGSDLQKFCAYYKIADLTELPASKFAAAVKLLEAKRAK